MKHLTLLSITTLALFTACTPSTIDPTNQAKITVDGFDIKPGQTWEIKAWGGDGWNDSATLSIGHRYWEGYKTTALLSGDVTVQVLEANPDYGYPVRVLSLAWKSHSAQLAGQTVYCKVREPKLSAANPASFEGRWIASSVRAEAYEKNGDTTGTGTCTIKLVSN